MSKPPCDDSRAVKAEVALLQVPVILHALSNAPDALGMLPDVMQAMIDASYQNGFVDGFRHREGGSRAS